MNHRQKDAALPRGWFLRDRRQFEVIESRQMDHLRVFHDVARALTSSLELEEILGAIMDKMAQFFGPERWSLLMVDDATKNFTTRSPWARTQTA